MTGNNRFSRRDFLKGGAVGASIFGANMLPFILQRAAAQDTPIRAAISNAGLQATWYAQGADTAMRFGELFGVEVTWFDGELNAEAQRSKFDQIASTPDDWDFVAVQAFQIDSSQSGDIPPPKSVNGYGCMLRQAYRRGLPS